MMRITPRQKYQRKRAYLTFKPNPAVKIFKSKSHGFFNSSDRNFYFHYSWNENLTWEMINAKHSSYWQWEGISSNPHITWQIIMENEHLPWSWCFLSSNPNITWANVLKRIDKEWSWDSLSRHINITWDIISANPDKPWKCGAVSANPNITFEIVKQNESYAWSLGGLLCNPNITMEMLVFIEQKSIETGIRLDWQRFAYNDAVTWEMALAYKKQLKNNWSLVFGRPKITWENILFAINNKFDDFNRNICVLPDAISRNVNLPRDIIKLGLQQRPIENIRHKLLNRSCLMGNPIVTYDIIKEAFDECNEYEQKYFWFDLNNNPNITLETLLMHTRKYISSRNPMTWDDFVYERNIAADIKLRRELIEKIYIVGIPLSIVARYLDYI